MLPIIAIPTHVFNSDDTSDNNLIFSHLQATPKISCNNLTSGSIREPINPSNLEETNEEIIPISQPDLPEDQKENLLHKEIKLLHHFKSHTKIVFGEKDNPHFYRGVLLQKSPYKWTISYKISNRNSTSFNISTDDLHNCYTNKFLMFGHKISLLHSKTNLLQTTRNPLMITHPSLCLPYELMVIQQDHSLSKAILPSIIFGDPSVSATLKQYYHISNQPLNQTSTFLQQILIQYWISVRYQL